MIKKRLLGVAGMVSGGGRLCDVGCDHAYLPIYLVEKGIVDSAIACDLKEEPLKRAGENVNKHGLSDKIELRLSDGLQEIKPCEADTITICGMGGMLISRIIADGIDTIKAAKELIISPQSDLVHLRRSLYEYSLEISDEDMVKEDDKYYFLIRCEYKENLPKKAEHRDFSDYGNVLEHKNNPYFKEYLKKEHKRLCAILLKLPDSAADRKKEIEAKLYEVEKCLSGM